MHLSGASGDTQRARGKLASCQNSVVFSKHRWKTDMTFSLRLQCSALCVYFPFCSLEIRRGADEPNEQHRRRGDVSALKVFAVEQENCFPDKREHKEDWELGDKGQGGTTVFVGLRSRPACQWDLMKRVASECDWDCASSSGQKTKPTLQNNSLVWTYFLHPSRRQANQNTRGTLKNRYL